MKVVQFVALISFNDISKLFSVVWVEAAYENLLNGVVQEFEIPPHEASEIMLCDLEGASHTKDSFEEDVCRSISEGRVPHFRVITGVALSENLVTPSTNQSEYKEEVEQQNPEETDLSSTANILFSKLRRIEENLNKAEYMSGLYETEIESSNPGIPESEITELTHELNEPEADTEELQYELETRQIKLELFQKALLEFESRLKKRERTLNQQDIELNKLRKRLNRRDEKLKNREMKIKCRESEVALPHYSVNQIEEILHQISSDMNTKSKQLNEDKFVLGLKATMLNEEKNKIKTGRKIVKSKKRKCKMEVDANLDEKEDTAKFHDGTFASKQYRSGALSERVLMEVNKQKRRGSASSGISDEKQAKLMERNSSLIDEQAMLMDFNVASTNADQPMKFNNQQTLKTARKFKTKKTSN